MSGDQPVLLCYDGSPDAAEAIRHAAGLTGGGPAVVLYVWLPPSALMLAGRTVAADHPLSPAIGEVDAAAREEADRVVAEGVRIATEAGFDASPMTERAGRGVWRAIVKIADEQDVRAVVVGSHGHSAASAVLGSVSHGVVNHSRRPVLVAPCSGDHGQADPA